MVFNVISSAFLAFTQKKYSEALSELLEFKICLLKRIIPAYHLLVI